MRKLLGRTRSWRTSSPSGATWSGATTIGATATLTSTTSAPCSPPRQALATLFSMRSACAQLATEGEWTERNTVLAEADFCLL